MRDANMIVRDRQRSIRREMDRRGISLKQVAYDGDMSVSTVTSYFHNEQLKEPATLNVAGLYRLLDGDALPLELLSMLLPDGYQIVRAPEDLDHDALCEMANRYVRAKIDAHHPESEAGREIGPGEDAGLTALIVELRAAA